MPYRKKRANLVIRLEDVDSRQGRAVFRSGYFQGLESEVAILVIPVTEEHTRIGGSVILPRQQLLNKMLYTGMSRAKAMLIIVADESYERTLERQQTIGHPPSHS